MSECSAQLREAVEKFLSKNSPTAFASEKAQGGSEESNTQDFKDINILVGVPTHDGTLHHIFVSSLISTSQMFANLGIRHHIEFVSGISLITIARNLLANLLFEGDSSGTPYTHLLFLDGDQGWSAQDILRMISANVEIVGLPTTLKGYDWGRIGKAAIAGAVPKELKRFGGYQNFDDLPGVKYPIDDKAVEVAKVGSAMMLIRKSVFEKLSEAHPEWRYRRFPHEKQNPNRQWDCNYFQTVIDEVTGHVLTEDWFFCREAKKLNIPTHIIPNAVTSHIGSTRFVWDARAIAELHIRNGAAQPA